MKRGALVVLLACLGPSFAQRATVRAWLPPEKLVALDSAEITESSGFASSSRDDTTFYTHNDSGDVARFFRFDIKGRVTGEYLMPEATAIDWEDIASARLEGRDYLFLGDIGDNAKKRKNITVYRVEEPRLSRQSISRFETYRLQYPDGAHNAEALMVHPKTGDLWIVTKVSSGKSQVFTLPMPKKSSDYTLKFVGTVEVGTMVPGSQMVTGGDISPDGAYVMLRSYTAAYEFAVPREFARWIDVNPKRVDLAAEGQGEAIGYSRDGRTVYTTSEGNPCPLNRVRLKG